MRILLLGAQGQLGHELLRALRGLGEVTPVARKLIPGWPNTLVCDLSHPANWQHLWAAANTAGRSPDVIVNAAAWTAVDAAEQQAAAAEVLNHALPANLAEHAQRYGARLIHVSTDYVFAGAAQRPYRESDPPAPQSVYGYSKLAGEQAVLQSAADCLVVRTSWVYSGRRQNFVRAMLSRMLRGEPLRVVDDQYGCPTWARDLADGIVHALLAWPQLLSPPPELPVPDRVTSGPASPQASAAPRLFHLAGTDSGSWFEFAQQIATAAQACGLLAQAPSLTAITTADYPTPAARPSWSVLDSERFASCFGYRAGGWQSLYACIEELKEARCWFP